MKIRKAAYAINLTLVTILGIMVLKIILIPHNIPVSVRGQNRNVSLENNSPSLPPQNLNSSDYENIVENNLFSNSDPVLSGNQALQANQSDASGSDNQPKLDLELQGIIAGPPDIARALIKDLVNDTFDTYRTGNLVGNARIVAIKKHSVVLARNGLEYTLTFNHTVSNAEISQNQPTQQSLESLPTINPTDISMAVKNQVMEDILNHAWIEPYLVNSQSQGLQLSNLDKVDKAKLLGLKDGDVIRLVNGQLITNKQKAFQVIRKARTQPFLDVELQRDGATKTISYPSRKNKK